MKKLILTIILVAVTCCLFAASESPKLLQTKNADVTFNLTGEDGVKFDVGFTSDVESLKTTPSWGNTTIDPAETFSITSIVQNTDGKNVGVLSDNAYIYWIIVGNNKLNISLAAPTEMAGITNTGNKLGLTTQIVETKDRGETYTAPERLVFQQNDKAMNWGYAKLKFTTGDLATAVADSYSAELILTVSSNQ